jgi:hypothetical protein
MLPILLVLLSASVSAAEDPLDQLDTKTLELQLKIQQLQKGFPGAPGLDAIIEDTQQIRQLTVEVRAGVDRKVVSVAEAEPPYLSPNEPESPEDEQRWRVVVTGIGTVLLVFLGFWAIKKLTADGSSDDNGEDEPAPGFDWQAEQQRILREHAAMHAEIQGEQATEPLPPIWGDSEVPNP